MHERLLVLGGNAAGMSAAMQVRRRQPEREIVVLEKSRWTSTSTCGIPYLVGGLVDGLDDLVVRSPETFRREHHVDVRLQCEAKAIDLAERRVEAWDHEAARMVDIGFGELHLATGAIPVRPGVPGVDLPFVHGVQTLDDAERLLPLARAGAGRRVVVVGGGYIGLEMAEAFVRAGSRVTLIEAAEQLMPTLDPDVAAPLTAAVERIGVEVRLGTRLDGIEPDGAGGGGSVVAGGEQLGADLVVVAVGVRPNAELAADAGLETGVTGAVRTDRRQRASAEGVWAAGDCCEALHLVARAPVHVPLGTHANKQGRVAGINIAGGYASFPGVLGTAVTRVCDTEVGRTGLSASEAERHGFATVAATVEGTTQAGYLPGGSSVMLKVLAEVGTGRVLGAQVIGEEGAAKRIDTLAVVVQAGMTVDQVLELDLGYAPPFGPVWDPVLLAARRLADALARRPRS